MSLVKTLDFALFRDGTEAQRKQLGAELAEGFVSAGFVKLINHGIPEETVHKAFGLSKQFFELPLATKAAVAHIPGPKPQRGWSAVYAERVGPSRLDNLERSGQVAIDELLDEKEHFDWGPRDDREFPNPWPDKDFPEFRQFMEEYFDTCHDLSIMIMEALEVGLKIPTGSLVQRCLPAHSEARVLHYPPVDVEVLKGGKTRRIWPHTDFGIITLLFQDGVGGLELEDRSVPGSFVPVVAQPEGMPSELVVNTSETLQRLTNDYIRAGLHQVNIPAQSKDSQKTTLNPRYSIAFFFKASREVNVGPLKSFVTEERPTTYKDMTALDFNRERNATVFKNAKVGKVY
jgi:isopenicillin N synthase-like dioxygenase